MPASISKNSFLFEKRKFLTKVCVCFAIYAAVYGCKGIKYGMYSQKDFNQTSILFYERPFPSHEWPYKPNTLFDTANRPLSLNKFSATEKSPQLCRRFLK
jgi:hypothetical protein